MDFAGSPPALVLDHLAEHSHESDSYVADDDRGEEAEAKGDAFGSKVLLRDR